MSKFLSYFKKKPITDVTGKEKPQYLTGLQRFLRSDPDNVIVTGKLTYLSDIRNPCFVENEDLMGQENVTLKRALSEKWRIRCLPYLYLAGELYAGCRNISIC